jgi:hypothetical protein
MPLAVTEEIENQFAELPHQTQLTVMERLIHRMREREQKEDAAFEAEMAADPEIQREIREINDEFRCTEGDGLKGL